MRTTPGSESIRRGRLSKAAQFQRVAMDALELAEEHYEVADAVATLCIHAGIAASDAICIARLGHFAQGQDHNDAVALLKSVDGGAVGLCSPIAFRHRRRLSLGSSPKAFT